MLRRNSLFRAEFLIWGVLEALGSCSKNRGFRVARVVRCHSENGISHSGYHFLNSESCSENTPELSELREWPFHSESVFPGIGVLPRLLSDAPYRAILFQRYPPLAPSFTETHLCDTPFCNISPDNFAILRRNKHQIAFRDTIATRIAQYEKYRCWASNFRCKIGAFRMTGNLHTIVSIQNDTIRPSGITDREKYFELINNLVDVSDIYYFFLLFWGWGKESEARGGRVLFMWK